MVQSKKRKKLFGLISYQLRWGLTLKGWLIILVTCSLIFWTIISHLHSFLAYSQVTKPAEILVVEGWIGDQALQGAIDEFNQQDNNYQLLITTGIPLHRGEHLAEYKNYAELSKASLMALGFEPQKIKAIPTSNVSRDRTLASAKNVKAWLQQTNFPVKAINVYTEGVHSRRTWSLYKKVLEPQTKIGAIAHPTLSYDSQSWWSSSQGFKQVILETIAYIYTKFLSKDN